MANFTLTLTPLEASYLSEAVRLAQQECEEGTGELSPVLSRVQRKMGNPVGAE